MILYPFELDVKGPLEYIFAVGNLLPSKEAGALLLHRIELFSDKPCKARLFAINSMDISESGGVLKPSVANSTIGSQAPFGVDAIILPVIEKPEAVQYLKTVFVEKNESVILADEKDGIAIPPGFYVFIVIEGDGAKILGNVLCQNQLKQG